MYPLNVIVHQVELPQILERLQALDHTNGLMCQIQNFDLFLPISLSVLMVVVVLSIAIVLSGFVNQVLSLILDLIKNYLSTECLGFFVDSFLVFIAEDIAI